MNDSVTTPPPIDSEGMNIHLSYIRRDVDAINKKLDGLTNAYVTREEFTDHVKIDEDHETRIRFLEESVIKTISMIRTWGTIGGIVLGGLQAVEIVYSLTHLK